MRKVFIIVALSLAISNGFAQDGWILRKSGTVQNLNSISSSDGQNVVAVGANSTITVSHTGGVTWMLLDNFRAKQITQGKDLKGVAAISDKIFCTVGLLDSIYRSTDKGNSWRGVRGSFDACTRNTQAGLVPPLYAIDFDSTTGISVAVGLNSLAVFSPDSGRYWEENAPIQQRYFDLDCVSMNNGVLLAGTVGLNEGHSYVTTDQGYDWQIHWVQKNIAITGCDKASWTMVGPGGTIYHSPNKGGVWDSIWGGTRVNFNDVHFGNSVRGYIVGDNGTILYSTDGGYTWTQQFSPTHENLRSIHMSDPFHGFICGDNGVILTTQNGGFYDDVSGPLPLSGSPIRSYPNPFSSRTTFEFPISKRGFVRVRIYNLLGEEVAT
ncbi:MAG: YCF48-related protein, partial [Ignavibacteriota bacterium]